MPLGRVIAELRADLRNRVEVGWHHDAWHVTASTFESALAYVEARFDDPAVLARRDHGRRRPRVTLTVTTDPERAATAPPLSELADPPAALVPPVPKPRTEAAADLDPVAESSMPPDLEAIFARQNDVNRSGVRSNTDQ